jgi:hypothetical protein
VNIDFLVKSKTRASLHEEQLNLRNYLKGDANPNVLKKESIGENRIKTKPCGIRKSLNKKRTLKKSQ